MECFDRAEGRAVGLELSSELCWKFPNSIEPLPTRFGSPSPAWETIAFGGNDSAPLREKRTSS